MDYTTAGGVTVETEKRKPAAYLKRYQERVSEKKKGMPDGGEEKKGNA